MQSFKHNILLQSFSSMIGAFFILMVIGTNSCNTIEEAFPQTPIVELATVEFIEQDCSILVTANILDFGYGILESGIKWSLEGQHPRKIHPKAAPNSMSSTGEALSMFQFSISVADSNIGKSYVVWAFVRDTLNNHFSQSKSVITSPWKEIAPFPGGSRSGSVAFNIDGRGFFGMGEYKQDFWEFHPWTNSWSLADSFPGKGRNGASSFVIGGNAYVCCGASVIDTFPTIFSTELRNDFWKYSLESHTWTRKSDIPFAPRKDAFGFALDGKGYIAFGTPNDQNIWEYHPGTDSWQRKTTFPGLGGRILIVFLIDHSLYAGLEYHSPAYSVETMLKYDFDSDLWSIEDDFPGQFRRNGLSFSVNGSGFFALGYRYNSYGWDLLHDIWQYDPKQNPAWRQRISFHDVGMQEASVLIMNGVAYISSNDFWAFNP